MATKPNLCLISTGGTIAGKAAGPEQGASYRSAELTADLLLASVPKAKELATWTLSQPYSIGSQHATLEHFLKLRESVLLALNNSEVDGVLITHGTDTMEEAIYFLLSTLPVESRSKPIVLTGAMRPSDHEQADGPTNLMNSVKVLCKAIHSANQSDHSLLGLCMNGLLIDSVSVRKAHTQCVGAFDIPDGVLIEDFLKSTSLNLPIYFTNRGPGAGEFSALGLFQARCSLQETKSILEKIKVGLLYCRPDLFSIQSEVDFFIKQQFDVVLIASYGNGNVPEHWTEPLHSLVTQGIRLVRASRVDQGGVSEHTEPCDLDDLAELTLKNGHPALSKAPQGLSLPQLFIRERFISLS